MAAVPASNKGTFRARQQSPLGYTLTDGVVKIGDHRSERDDYQLDGLFPFGPLNVMR
jgi:hypothetical protein